MALSRLSLLMDFVTAPTDLSNAVPHAGGWSEGHWVVNVLAANDPRIRQLATYRARMLPIQASVIGFRIAVCNIQGNAIVPGGTSGGKFNFPGGFGGGMNLPQDAIALSAAGFNSPNSTKFTLRGIPDDVIANGEFQPGLTSFYSRLNAYTGYLIGAEFGWIGQDISQPLLRVNSIAGNVIILSGGAGGAVGDSLKLKRVTGAGGAKVTGTFVITAIAGSAYTVTPAPSASVVTPSGFARIAKLAFTNYGQISVGRAVSRKVGRPFDSYRGRASARK